MTWRHFWRAKWISSLSFDLCRCKEPLRASKGRDCIWRCRCSALPLFKGSERLRPGQRQNVWQAETWRGQHLSAGNKEKGCLEGLPEPLGEEAAFISTTPGAPLHGSKPGPTPLVALVPNPRQAKLSLCCQLEFCGRGYKLECFFTFTKDGTRKKSKPTLRDFEKAWYIKINSWERSMLNIRKDCPLSVCREKMFYLNYAFFF